MYLLNLVLLPLLISCGAIVTSSNKSSGGPYGTVINCPVSAITGNMSDVPYQYTAIEDSGLIRMGYNFSSTEPFPAGMVSMLVQKNVEDFRVDGYEDFKIDIDINLVQGTGTIAYDSYLEVKYLYRQSNNQINLKVYYWRGPTATCLTDNLTTLSGIQFGLKLIKTNEYALEVCSPSPTYLRKTFDLTQLGRYFISLKILRLSDLRKSIKIHIRTQGSGEITFLQKVYRVEREQYVFNKQLSYAGFAMANQPFYNDWSRQDFMNMSLPVNGSIQGIICQAYFVSTNPNTVNGHHWILVGMFFGKWVTPINSFGLPVEVHTDINLFVDFSFTPSTSAAPAGRAACYLLNFCTNDKILNQLDSGSISLSRQIIITAWASPTFKSWTQGVHKATVTYFDVNWRIILVGNQGHDYSIQTETNLEEMKNFDIFAFIRYLRDTMHVFSSREYLMTVQTGFRYCSGRSKFAVQRIGYINVPQPFQLTKIWTAQNNPILPPISSLQSCYILTNKSTICDKAQTFSSTIEGFISIPSISILIRLLPLISLVDDFAFYVYHRPKYDKGFEYIVRMCSEWTQSKWVPPFLDKLDDWLSNVSDVVNNTNIDGETIHQPNKFQQSGLGNNFYNNISDFLVLSLPFNLATYLILKSLEWILRRLGILHALQALLKPFRSIVSFISCVLAENMTYLSFHCFLQIYNFAPYSHGQNSFPSCVICLFTLFTILMTGVCLGFIAWVFARHIFEIDYCKVNFKSYMFLSFVVAGKFVSGFFHAFIDDAKDRALGLLIVNGCVLVVLLFCCKTMQIKTYFIIYLGIYLGKVVLHIQLLYEMWVPEVLIKIEGSASENSLILVISIFGFMLMISFISIFKSISTFITKRAKPKLHSHQQTGKLKITTAQSNISHKKGTHIINPAITSNRSNTKLPHVAQVNFKVGQKNGSSATTSGRANLLKKAKSEKKVQNYKSIQKLRTGTQKKIEKKNLKHHLKLAP